MFGSSETQLVTGSELRVRSVCWRPFPLIANKDKRLGFAGTGAFDCAQVADAKLMMWAGPWSCVHKQAGVQAPARLVFSRRPSSASRRRQPQRNNSE